MTSVPQPQQNLPAGEPGDKTEPSAEPGEENLQLQLHVPSAYDPWDPTVPSAEVRFYPLTGQQVQLQSRLGILEHLLNIYGAVHKLCFKVISLRLME